MDRVTYAPPPENALTKYDNATITEHPEKNTDGPTYVVDKLVGHRRKTEGTLEFLVRWYGYEEQIWEPQHNIPEELVSRHFETRKTNDERRSHNEDTPREPNVNANKNRDTEKVATNELRKARDRL